MNLLPYATGMLVWFAVVFEIAQFLGRGAA